MPDHQKKSAAKKPHTARLFGLIIPEWKRLSIGLLAMFLTTACMLSLPQYLKHLFDNALQTGDLTALTHMVVWVMATVVVLSIGVLVRTYFLQYTAAFIVARFREKIFAHILSFDISFFENFGTGEVISRLISDIVVIREFIQFSLPALLRGMLLALGSTTLLLMTNTKLTLILFAVGAPIVLVAIVLGKTWKGYSKKIQEMSARLAGQAEEAIYAIRTVRVFGQESGTTLRYHNTMNEALAVGKRLILSNGAFFAFSLFMAFSAILLVLWLGGRDVIQGEMSLGQMMSFLIYLAFLGDGFSNLSNFFPALQTAAGATERVFELMAETPKLQESTTPKKLPSAKGGREMVLKGVSFHYASRPEQAALAGVDVTIKAGETVALVGPSGAGKSSLLALLLRFYDPQQGAVLLDSVPLQDLSFADLRQNVGLVAQDATIFSTSVRENIAYGKPGATEEEILQAAKAAHAHEFIQTLPQGYETEVGEKGVKLSGGQKQRLAIARTLLVNPAVLLLDEATSHLDAESERAVQQALEEVRQNRTMLVVAHRLATVQSADRILVMDEGKIVAQGTHKELLVSSPLYKHLAELQLLG